MACSKLFSGGLPEISTFIIQNLRNDLNTLHSLALVNRFWCRLAIPLLWEDPFSIEYQKNTFHFLNTYFSFLNDNDKIKLKEDLNFCKFDKFDSSSQKPLFNYPSLIKTLDLCRTQIHVTSWLNSTKLVQHSSNQKPYAPLTLTARMHKLSVAYENLTYGKIKPIFIALFKLLIENNASLNNLYVNDYPSYQLFCDVINIIMILNNPKFISGIEILHFDYIDPQQLQLNALLSLSLPSLLTSVKHIDISTFEFETFFTNIIQSQSQLSSIKTKLIGVRLLDSLKHSSNTLTSINFSSCYFFNVLRFDALSHLTQLESLQFKNCIGLKSNVIQPLLSITTPLKIKTFVIVDYGIVSNVEREKIIPIQLLIQKISPYLENLVLDIYEDELRRRLFDTVIDFCGKTKFLHLNQIDFMNIPQLSKMAYNFNNHLKYLTLGSKIKYDGLSTFNYDYKEHLKLSSMILKELSKSLPLPLYYLDLNLIVINSNDLQVFLENYKQVELKKLLIRNWSNDNVDNTLNIIKDFAKETNLEFLTYSIGNYLSPEDVKRHKNLEKLVEETQSFVKMKIYDDLVVRVSEIDGNLIID